MRERDGGEREEREREKRGEEMGISLGAYALV